MKSPLTILILIAVAACVASDARPRAAHLSPSASSPAVPAESVQVINMTAKKYEFDPATIHVKQGTKVQIKISATDHAHGLKISEIADGDSKGKPGLVFTSGQDCTKVEEGQSATVEFVAQAPGTYSFRCCVHCGWHHRAMKGAVVVEP